MKRALSAIALLGSLAVITGCDLQEDADIDRGRALFTQKCGTCHALAEAGSTVNIGPDLDAAFAEARANGMDQDTIEGVVENQIQIPRPASPEDTAVYMPADIVEGDDLTDVAAYVARYAGVPGVEPPSISEFFVGSCGGCHTFTPAGTTGTIGPNLDETLAGDSAAQIEESIVNPNAQSTPGYELGVMPPFSSLPPEQLQQLVDFLMGTGSGGAGAGKKQPQG